MLVPQNLDVPYTLGDFADSLAWSNGYINPTLYWKSSYISILNIKFEAWLRKHPVSPVRNAWEILEPNKFEEVLLAPNVAWHLLNQIDSENLEYWLTLECVRILNNTNAKVTTNLPSTSLGSGLECVVGILVDFDSEFEFPSRGQDTRPLRSLMDDDKSQVTDALVASLTCLQIVFPQAYNFVSMSTTRLAIRAEREAEQSYTSGSFSGFAGLTLITNLHMHCSDKGKIIDSLVHESIHAVIYMYEVLIEPMCSEHSKDFRIQSCWTNRWLTLDQYVQACFVWWGLYNLWAKWPIESGGIESERITRLRNRAAYGFRNGPVEILLKQLSGKYLPEKTITGLQVIAKASRAIPG